ncbi:MAG: hypothetical protein M3O50_13940 [Myxococcota bacterium]|nr:hypothetical protein [Myxococcota bacterium]
MTFTNQTYANDPRARAWEAVFTGVNTLDDPYAQIMRLHNGSSTPVTVTSVAVAPNGALFPADFRQHSNATAFRATVSSEAGSAFPATIAAGGDLDVEVRFLSTKTNPPPRFDNVGGEAVAAWLVARTDSDCAQAGLYGLSFWNNSESINDAGVPSPNYARYEPTLGQIIATLGYRVDIGNNLKTYLNVNQVTPSAMAAPPEGDAPSDEVLVRDFVKADPAKPVVLLAVGRFAPKVDYPFGWFATGSVEPASAQPAALPPLLVPDRTAFPKGLQYVAAMSSVNLSDSYTSDHSEMLFPPINGNAAGSFDPGAASFGLWCFTAQRSDGTVSFDGGVTPNVMNGDYDYSYDELNIVTGTPNPPLPSAFADAGVNFGKASPVHRYRIWPLRDRAGNALANSYLVGLEEATNDDYQDMIFTLSNVRPVRAAVDGGSPAPTDAGLAADADSSLAADADPRLEAGAKTD